MMSMSGQYYDDPYGARYGGPYRNRPGSPPGSRYHKKARWDDGSDVNSSDYHQGLSRSRFGVRPPWHERNSFQGERSMRGDGQRTLPRHGSPFDSRNIGDPNYYNGPQNESRRWDCPGGAMVNQGSPPGYTNQLGNHVASSPSLHPTQQQIYASSGGWMPGMPSVTLPPNTGVAAPMLSTAPTGANSSASQSSVGSEVPNYAKWLLQWAMNKPPADSMQTTHSNTSAVPAVAPPPERPVTMAAAPTGVVYNPEEVTDVNCLSGVDRPIKRYDGCLKCTICFGVVSETTQQHLQHVNSREHRLAKYGNDQVPDVNPNKMTFDYGHKVSGISQPQQDASYENSAALSPQPAVEQTSVNRSNEETPSEKKNSKAEFVLNPKGKAVATVLQEYVKRMMNVHVEYVYKTTGDEEKAHSATVVIRGVEYGTGKGTCQKTARHEAAKVALKALSPGLAHIIGDKDEDWAAGEKLDSYCRLCDFDCISKKCYTAHCASVGHKNALDAITEKQSYLITPFTYYCHGCQENLITAYQYRKHVSQYRHRQVYVKQAAPIPPLTYYCNICHFDLGTWKKFDDHLSGSEHLLKYNVGEKLEKEYQPFLLHPEAYMQNPPNLETAEAIPEPESNGLNFADILQEAKSFKKDPGDGMAWYCRLCEYDCQHWLDFSCHFSSPSHNANVQRAFRRSMTGFNPDLLRCGTCGKTFRTAKEYRSHFGTSDHCHLMELGRTPATTMLYFCDTCHVHCENLYNFSEHEQTTEHLRKSALPTNTVGLGTWTVTASGMVSMDMLDEKALFIRGIGLFDWITKLLPHARILLDTQQFENAPHGIHKNLVCCYAIFRSPYETDAALRELTSPSLSHLNIDASYTQKKSVFSAIDRLKDVSVNNR